MIDFRTEPATYRHWKLSINGRVATLSLSVDEAGGLRDGYELKLNSYDLGVDIELYDATQRLRFEHPEVAAVILTSAKDRIFCAGANIRMLATSSHDQKVNFCKFTNETRNGIEDASQNSSQTYIAAVNGPCAGGGYELALACDQIVMIDDGSTTVSLPEIPLLAVLPGTGGLTRLSDKRKVRRDRADFFCTLEEGMRGQRAVDWRLIDHLAPRSRYDEVVNAKAEEAVAKTDRPPDLQGIRLAPIKRKIVDDTIKYTTLTIEIDRDARTANLTIFAPTKSPPVDGKGIRNLGDEFWPLCMARELDDAILHLRTNENEIGTWLFQTSGDAALVTEFDATLAGNQDDWLVREITLFLQRVFKRIDVTSRSIFAIIEPASCFTGTLLELALAADRSYMLDGQFEGDNRPEAMIKLTAMNFGFYEMVNGLTRLQSRFLNDPLSIEALSKRQGEAMDALVAEEAGLVTFAPDDIDWEDEVRIAVEERAAFSPDALTGMEANLRFGGQETMESKIFSRLSAWQNWIFQRPNAVGETGALPLYGSGQRSEFDKGRV